MEEDFVQNPEEEIIDPKRLVKTVRKKREIRRVRRTQGVFRNFLRFVLTVLLLMAFVYISKMPQWYLDKRVFTTTGNNSVVIYNNNIVKSYRILALLKASEVPEVPIYMANTAAIEKQIKSLAPVEDVYIRRYAFPARLQIILKERVPVLTISPDVKVPPVVAFTKDGRIIGKEFLPLDKKFKTILVLSYGNKGDDYTKWNAKKVQQIEKIVKYVETYSKEPIEYIDFRNPDDVFVKIKTVPIRIGKIDENVFKRIERIPSILPQVKLVDSKVKYLDLSWEKVNYLKLE